jgi:drug/metabolite transporter (DMT)-like permease
MPASRFIPYLLLLIAMLCWAGNYVVGRAIQGQIPPLMLSFLRTFVAVVLITPFTVMLLKQQWQLIVTHIKILLLLGILGVAGFNSILYIGLKTTTVTNAALLASASPMIILLFSFLLLKIKPNRYQMIGVILSFFGVVIIVSQADWLVLKHFALTQGDLWVLLSVVMWSLYSVLLRWRPPELHSLTFLSITIIIGFIALIPFALGSLIYSPAWTWSPAVMGSVLYTGIFPLLIAYICWNQAIQDIGANRAGQFLHLIPVFATSLSILFLNETMQHYHLVGIAFIAIGILSATVFKNKEVV